jgi:hypothetical protein
MLTMLIVQFHRCRLVYGRYFIEVASAHFGTL